MAQIQLNRYAIENYKMIFRKRSLPIYLTGEDATRHNILLSNIVVTLDVHLRYPKAFQKY